MSVTDLLGAPLPPQTVVIERSPVSNFARAVGADSAIHQDPAAATAAGFDAIPAPPTFAFAMHHWGRFAELQPEGWDAPNPMNQAISTLTAGGGLILHGEQEFTYHRPILVGDVLTGTGAITEVYEKEGSGGRAMTFVVSRTDWHDADGGPVVTAVFHLIHRS